MELASHQYSGLLSDLALCFGVHEMMAAHVLCPLKSFGLLSTLAFPYDDVPNEPRCGKRYGILRPCWRQGGLASQRW